MTFIVSFHQIELQQGWDASFVIAPKQTKVQGNEANKTEKPNKSSYISHGGSVESKSKSHNFTMVCVGPNLHTHVFLSAKILWYNYRQTSITVYKTYEQFLPGHNTVTLSLRAGYISDKSIFCHSTLNNSPLEISSWFEFVLCPPYHL